MRKLVLLTAILLTVTGFTAATNHHSAGKAELIDSIASEADITKSDAKKGNKIALKAVNCPERCGETVSEVASERSARKGRNPQTGKEIKIPAKKVVKFKPGAELSEKVKMAEWDDLTMSRGAKQGEKMMSDGSDVCSHHGPCTSNAASLSDLDGDGDPDMIVVNTPPEAKVGGDSAMGQEELTIAYDRYKRTQ